MWWNIVEKSFSSIEDERSTLQQVALIFADAETNGKYRYLVTALPRKVIISEFNSWLSF